MKNGLKITELSGKEAQVHLASLAHLRIKIFREFPYLYEGDLKYEEKYLDTYFNAPKSFVAICLDGETAVGAATAIPLQYEESSFQKPFIDKGMRPEEICYYGESLLLPEYRGLGIGKKFMHAREHFARSQPLVRYSCFCAVVREDDHPAKPKNYRPLYSFWEQTGFHKMEGFTTSYTWKEPGNETEISHQMQFWIKELK